MSVYLLGQDGDMGGMAMGKYDYLKNLSDEHMKRLAKRVGKDVVDGEARRQREKWKVIENKKKK